MLMTELNEGCLTGVNWERKTLFLFIRDTSLQPLVANTNPTPLIHEYRILSTHTSAFLISFVKLPSSGKLASC